MKIVLFNLAFPFPGGANSWPNKVWFGFVFFLLYLSLMVIDGHGIQRMMDVVCSFIVVCSLAISANLCILYVGTLLTPTTVKKRGPKETIKHSSLRKYFSCESDYEKFRRIMASLEDRSLGLEEAKSIAYNLQDKFTEKTSVDHLASLLIKEFRYKMKRNYASGTLRSISASTHLIERYQKLLK